jgi:hypothetical protein
MTARRQWKIVWLGLAAVALVLAITFWIAGRDRVDIRAGVETQVAQPHGRGRALHGSVGPSGPASSVPRLRKDPAALSLPEPEAVNRFLAEVNKKRKPGEKQITLLALYEEEPRHPWWAGAMENAVKDRFADSKLRELGLETLKVDELECRTNTCKITVSWEQQAQDAAGRYFPDAHERNPLEMFAAEAGPLGTLGGPLSSTVGRPVPGGYGARLRPDGRSFVTHLFAFDEEGIDPGTYPEWVDRIVANTRERRRTFSEQGAGKPSAP